MAWLNVADSTMLDAGQRLRVVLSGGDVEIGTDEEKMRAAVQANTSLNVTRIERYFRVALIQGWYIEATLADNIPVALVRADMINAITVLRSEWGVIAPGLAVEEIQVWQPSASDLIPTVPTSTALTLVAIAVLAIVGFLLFRTYVK